MGESFENDLKVFGENLRNIRKAKKLSTEKLANIADMELVQVNRIELGKTNPKLTTVYALAKALEISPAELFTANGSE